ncbi:hypothetical protein [Agrococcus beijingensis]|uniref:hypothetical protein n=1 Tax=Agrococcus beijingensis TaxID=3068634 RepID=UPI002742927B|nr:hypothetical protein [Agrococcus sp. REN33]
MPLRTRPSQAAALALMAALLLTACVPSDVEQPERTAVQTSEPASAQPERAAVQTSEPDAVLTVIADPNDQDASIATSRVLFDAAPLVVIAAAGDAQGQELSARAAIALGVPLLVAQAETAPEAGAAIASPAPLPPSPTTPDADGASALSTELHRLAATTALVIGDVARLPEEGAGSSVAIERVDATEAAVRRAAGATIGQPTAPDASGFAAGIAGLAVDAPGDTAAPRADAVPRPLPAAPLTDTLALAIDDVRQLGAIATARAAGVPVHLVPQGSENPQSTASVVDALHASTTTRTLALGAAFSARPALEWEVRSARGGFQLAGGGQQLFAQRQFVALYGTPSTSALGVLGEQDAAASIQRARDVAAPYAALTDKTVVPMFEIIATVAAREPGPDGNYSNELPVDELRPLVDAAAEAGIYVVIDLQPGRTDFLTQAQQYRSLLELPHVGLALDPEWRLAPDEVHLRQIGSVSAAEVNSVVTWLADLTNAQGLPQKMLVLHQFRSDMITDRQSLDLSRPELAMLLHVDGLGSQPEKQATWAALQRDAPEGLHWGWKNFYDEDLPMLTPEQTVGGVSPVPDLITYQ